MPGFDYTAHTPAWEDDNPANGTVNAAAMNAIENGLATASTTSKAALYTATGLDASGTTSSVAALQAVIDAALAAGGDVVVKVPRGRYLLDNDALWFDGGDTETSHVEIDWSGSTVLLGANLPTVAGFSDAARGWAIFVNTDRAAEVAGVVTVDDTTRSTGSSSGQLIGLTMRNAWIDDQGNNAGAGYWNRAPIRIVDVAYSGPSGFSGYDYTDVIGLHGCYARGSGTVFYLQTGQGDGVVITNPKADSTATFAQMTTCHGAVILGAVTTRFEFTRCTNIVMIGAHLEGQQSGRAMLVLVNSEVTLNGCAIYTLYAATATDTAPVLIQDTADTEVDSHLRVRDCTAVMFFNNGTGLHSPWLDIQSADDDTCVEVTGFRTRYASVALGGKWPETGQAWITGPANLLTELATPHARANLAAGAFTLRMADSSTWTCRTPLDHVKTVSGAQPAAPVIVQALTSSGVISGGTLTTSTYSYVTAAIDGQGNYTNHNAETTATPDAKGVVLLRITVKAPPVALVVWRKLGTGVATAPDAYAILPVGAREVRVYDVGGQVGGQDWDVTGVPAPDTVAGTNATASALVLT